MTSDSKIQANFKTGPGFDASLINLYADSAEELDALIATVFERVPQIISLQQQLQAGGVVAAALPVAAEQPVQASAAPPNVVQFPQAQTYSAPAVPAAPTGPEVISDRYGNRYTYGLADAPPLPDGRGYYIRKDWTSQKGSVLKAWVDPAKGPKPAQAGAVEAELIWIK